MAMLPNHVFIDKLNIGWFSLENGHITHMGASAYFIQYITGCRVCAESM